MAGRTAFLRRPDWARRTISNLDRDGGLGSDLGLYISFVNCRQTFYASVGKSILLEACSMAIFLGQPETTTNAQVPRFWLIRWLPVFW